MTGSDATSDFFTALSRRGREPLLGNVVGSVRFDLRSGERIDHWLVALTSGEAAVSRLSVDADCVVQAEKAVFDSIACGEANATAALLRGELTAEGNLEPLVVIQRLFPRPPSARGSGDRSARGGNGG